MCDFVSQVCEALQGSFSTDPVEMEKSLKTIQELRKQTIDYLNALIQIIYQNESMRKIALLESTKIINDKFEILPDEFKGNILNQMLQLFANLNDPMELKYLASGFQKFILSLDSAAIQSILFEKNEIKFPFQFELASFIIDNMIQYYPLICENEEKFVELAFFGLQQNDWTIKIKSIRMTSIIGGINGELIENNKKIILSLISQSTTLNEECFLSLWNEFGAFIETIMIDENECSGIFTSVFQAVQSDGFSFHAKLAALSIIPSLPINSIEIAQQVLNETLKLSALQVKNGEFLAESSDIFLKCSNVISLDEIYNWLKSVLLNDKSLSIIASILYILKEFSVDVGIKIRNDWEIFHQLLTTALLSQDVMAIEASLLFISSLTQDFESLLLESNLFIDQISPFVICNNSEIRHCANDALFSMLDNISFSFPGIVKKLWPLHASVNSNLSEFLTLLAKAIEKESYYFSFEEANQMCLFLIPLFQSEDDQIIIGALSIATSILLTQDDIDNSFKTQVAQTIEKYLVQDFPELEVNCMKRLSQLIDVLDFTEQIIHKILKIFTDNEVTLIAVRKASIDCIVAFIKKYKSVDLLSAFQKQLDEWLNSRNIAYLPECLNAIKELACELGNAIQPYVTKICEIASDTNDDDTFSDSLSVISAIINQTKNEILANSVIQFASMIFSDMHDKIVSKIDLLKPFASLLCELLYFNNEFRDKIFEFASDLIKTQDEERIDIAFAIFGDGIKTDAFDRKQINFITTYVTQQLISGTTNDLIHNIAYIFQNLIQKNILSIDVVTQIHPLLVDWQLKLMAMKFTMRPTLINISILLLTIAIQYGLFNEESILFAFEFYPPDDISDNILMSEKLILLFQSQLGEKLHVQIATSITKLLLIPKITLKNKVTPEILQKLCDILKELLASNNDIKEQVFQIASTDYTRNKLMGWLA